MKPIYVRYIGAVFFLTVISGCVRYPQYGGYSAPPGNQNGYGYPAQQGAYGSYGYRPHGGNDNRRRGNYGNGQYKHYGNGYYQGRQGHSNRGYNRKDSGNGRHHGD
jgi:hypothetical protein